MKKISSLIILCMTFMALHAQVLSTYYVDFGPNDGVNGNATSSPDANTLYWNNVTDPLSSATPVNLVDHQNVVSGLNLSVSQNLGVNGILNGGLTNPSASLGEFAIATVTEDYFFSYGAGELTISGLDPLLGYRFNMFGSRNISDVRTSHYKYFGANTVYDTLQTSGADIGGGNDATIAVSEIVRPTTQGEIKIKLNVLVGGYAYLNAMIVEEVDVNPEYFIDFGPNDVTNGNSTISPDANSHNWNNVNDPSVSPVSISLVDKEGVDNGNYIIVTDGFQMNGIQNGGLLVPTSNNLDEFAVATATEDYFFTTETSSFQLGGLQSDSKFIFTVFGTRNTTQERVSQYTITGDVTEIGSLQTSGLDFGGASYHGNNSTTFISDTVQPDHEGRITFDLGVVSGGFGYIGCIKIKEYVGVDAGSNVIPLCEDTDSLAVSYMGSSVAYGVGATNSNGYRRQYNTQLNERFVVGDGANWNPINIAVPGDNTQKVLDRFDQLITQCGRYVIFGLSLGNEGIHWNGQTAFDSFRDNMLVMIDSARYYGVEPIIMNCYTHNVYNSVDYDYVQQMNELINSWDVASVNLLGAVDDGNGNWAAGYFNDAGHPNDAGHTEFFYAMVPSMMDALNADIPQPQLVAGTFMSFDKSISNDQLEFVPEGIVHPFTYSFDVKTTNTGVISSFQTAVDTSEFDINSAGKLDYKTSGLVSITGVTTVNDGAWHKITLSHYYARGETYLYIDGVLQGAVLEQVVPIGFVLSGETSPSADYRELYFYRAGITQLEVSSMATGGFLKSSLEIYAPLDGQGVTSEDELHNYAQSLNTLTKTHFESTGLLVQAEEYVVASNVLTEPTSGGGINVTDYDAGEWMVWYVDLPTTGDYLVEYRVACTNNNGVIRFEKANTTTIYGYANVPNTGGDQVWQIANHTVSLEEGTQHVAIYTSTGGFNIDWIRLTSIQSTAKEATEVDESAIYVVPNPSSDHVSIVGVSEESTIEVFSASGEQVLTNVGAHFEVTELPCGVYILKVSDSTGIQFVKFMKGE